MLKETPRVKATKVAQALHMGRTMVAIQDDCSVEQAGLIAFEEHLMLHRNCPCCRGSVNKATEVSNNIVSIMNGVTDFSEK